MRILMLIKTTGLVYDDRLRKEVTSLQQHGHLPEIVVLESDNNAGFRHVFNQIPARTLHLRSRSWVPQARGLAIKTTELYLRFLIAVMRSRADVVWIHNMELSGLIPVLALFKRIGLFRYLVWDQHELPGDSTIQSDYLMKGLARVMNACDRIIMANDARRELLLTSFDGRLRTPIEILENYADTTFRDMQKEALPQSVTDWLDNEPYFLAQGGASPKRFLRELVQAILELEGVRLIVIGPYQQHDITYLRQQHGDQLSQRILFTGYVPQLQIVPYIDNALASVVLYDTGSENSRLCAPNRLYQALARGVPVVVGINPTMADLVNRYRCGVVLQTDGRDPTDIRVGLMTALDEQHILRHNTYAVRDRLLWERQEPLLPELLCQPPG